MRIIQIITLLQLQPTPFFNNRLENDFTILNYDKVTIRKRPDAADDSSFAQMLARKLTDRLAEGDNQEKVRRLQQEVASRTYEPDARRIAERMLGYR